MQELIERIKKDGKVLPGGVLKVGSFLNHCIDTQLLAAMAKEIARLYDGAGVTKIITIEASGIAIAAAAGMELGVPVIFAKKHRTTNVDGDLYMTVVHSYTHNEDYNVVVSSDCMGPGDKVLIIDDFLANGSSLRGLEDLINQAGAELVGVAVCVEKCFQEGGQEFRAQGVRVEALASILSMSDEGEIVFANED